MIRGIFVTDLDGTFIDHDTYEPGPSVCAARKLYDGGVQLAFCSSKTVAEQSAIRDLLAMPIVMIVENGSAIYRSGSDAPDVLGCRAEYIRQVASDVLRQANLDFRLMSEVEVQEVMRRTGLTQADAALAQQREFTDSVVSPIADERTRAELTDAFASRGLGVTMGGRFLTIHGADVSKGRAVARLIHQYRSVDDTVVSGAVGDGPNDVSMLEAVDYPYLVRGKGAVPSDLRLPGLMTIDEFGPNGFVLAAEDFLLRTTPSEGARSD